MRVISRTAIVSFGKLHPDALAALDAWYRTALRARWRSLVETREDFPHAGLVGSRTVFNIRGNNYRLIARVNYRTQRVFIRAILPHAEYDKGGWNK